MEEPEDFLDSSRKRLDEDEQDLEQEKDNTKEKKDIVDMKESIDKTKEIADQFKKSTEPGAAKTVSKFLAATTAVSVIFFFISYALAKLVSSDDGGGGDSDDSNKKKIAVIKALTDLGKDIRNWSIVMSVWFTAHQSEKVKVGGVDVPLVDIFTNYTTPMNTASY